MVRKHPLFPTYQEVKNDPNLARSDHLPIFTQVPLGEKNTLNIVSLNILGDETCSGVHPLGMTIPKEHTVNRYKHIAKGLGNSIQKHNVDIILLQEADPAIVPNLEQVLGEGWEIIVDKFSVISCYNKNRLKLEDTVENEAERIRSMQFLDTMTNLSIDVHNIWGIYNPFPQYMENLYRSVLTDTASNVSIIMGDTNSRLAPVDNNKRNLTTGIVPPSIAAANGLSSDIQITDHPDGGFYQNQSGSIQQLQIKTLDFDTGDIVIDERNEADIGVWPDYRMVMCLDDYYKKTALINGRTIFEYENSLKNDLGNDRLMVRMASDSYNNKAVAIRFPNKSPTFELIKTELKNKAGFQFRTVDSTAPEDGGEPFSCVFAPLDKIELLHQTMQKIMSETVLKYQVAQSIDSEIIRLKKSHWYFRDASEKISVLTDLRSRIASASGESTKEDLLSIIKTWEEESVPLSPLVSKNNIKNKSDLVGIHRNIFFSARRPGKSTATQDTLQWLKEALGDKPNTEAKP